MILVGNRRGGAAELAAHLLNVEDNEHVELHEVRGFVSDDLGDALHEAYGISRGTRCKKFLYSLSLSPPQDQNVPVEVFEATIDRIEQKLGFTGQPRAIVFHEKQGPQGYRRHAHVVWSRINADTMTAIDPYQDRLSLNEIGRVLFEEHRWEMPAGFKRKEDADPLNYSHAEYQQAKRAKRDVKELKRIFMTCWEQSDTRNSFAHALKEHGFILAKGDRRGFVAVDAIGEVYSVARYAGVKAKDLRARLGNLDGLPDVDTARKFFDQADQPKISVRDAFNDDQKKLNAEAELDALEQQLLAMVQEHRNARAALQQKQQTRRIEETKARQAKLPMGLKAVWFKLSGKYETLIAENEKYFARCKTRDRLERQNLIGEQLSERRILQKKILAAEQALNAVNNNEARFLSLDPEQALVIPPDPDALSIKDKVNQQPEHILEVLTDKTESFTRNDILRALANYVEDPLKLGSAIEQVMRSSELVVLKHSADGNAEINLAIKTGNGRKSGILYSTHTFQALKADLNGHVSMLSEKTSTFVSNANINAAIQQQNRKLNSEIGAVLSHQQQTAIRHCLKAKQLTAFVGLAGTGKSTILSAVKTALERQGFKTHGAALSGKAADGLEQASKIKSRTLASWARSWDQGKSLLTANDVMIIDEAGMIGTKQLLRFLKEIQRSGAKLILVGDPEQLQPINAGTPFRDFCETVNPAKLSEIHRQNHDWQKQASLDLAEQRTEDALKAYELHDKVVKTKDTSEAILRLVEDYMVDLELNDGTSTRLALAHRRKDVHAINQAIRQLRKSAGDLTQEILIRTDHGKRAFAKGDRIVFTQNDRLVGVRNGMLGTVKAITEDKIKVQLDGEPLETFTITINPNQFTAFDHGYATTIHKSQGVTVDRAFVLASPTMDRHLTYVAMTRHRHDAILYGDFSTLQNIRKVNNPQSKFTFNEQCRLTGIKSLKTQNRRPTMH